MPTIEEILTARADYSTFLVHLTRRQEEMSAADVLRTILHEGRLRAGDAPCLFSRRLQPGARDSFRVVCFTEAPIHQIKAFMEEIEGRQVQLEPYGLVFTKDFIASQGGNPTFYINTYHNRDLRDAAMALFNRAEADGFEGTPAARLLPFFSIFGRTTNGTRYDFYWEREWKVVGDVEFDYRDIVVALCPELEIDEFEDEFAGIKFIAPAWGLDRILLHLRGCEFARAWLTPNALGAVWIVATLLTLSVLGVGGPSFGAGAMCAQVATAQAFRFASEAEIASMCKRYPTPDGVQRCTD